MYAVCDNSLTLDQAFYNNGSFTEALLQFYRLAKELDPGWKSCNIYAVRRNPPSAESFAYLSTFTRAKLLKLYESLLNR